jgi:hypothetical protein
MSILAIDVGIKNLAFCCMKKSEIGSRTSITHSESDSGTTNRNLEIVFLELCNVLAGTQQPNCSNEKCKFKAKFTDSSLIPYCKRHFKSEPITKKNTIRIKKIKDFTYQELVKSVLICLNELKTKYASEFLEISQILIELQIKVNQKMKMISHVIFGKLTEIFMDLNLPKVKIRFISARNKLMHFQGPTSTVFKKNTYANRKKKSVEYVKWYLENRVVDHPKWIEFFNKNSSKADDISDTFLYCVNAIH